jgi:hypothetical protein
MINNATIIYITTQKTTQSGTESVQALFYICIPVADLAMKRTVGTPFTGLSPPHLFACIKPGF